MTPEDQSDEQPAEDNANEAATQHWMRVLGLTREEARAAQEMGLL